MCPIKGPRRDHRRDPEATRAAILAAAEAAFLAKGFAESSLAAIAQGAGVTKSLIHHHFGSKEALWQAVKLRKFASYKELQRRLLETAAAADAGLLADSIRAYFEFLRARPEVARLLSWVALEDEAGRVLDNSEIELFRLGLTRMEEAQAGGTLRPDLPAPLMLVGFLVLVEGWFQNRNRWAELGFPPASPADLDAQREGLVKLFLDGARPRNGED